MSVRIFEGEKHANLYSKFRPVVPMKALKIVLRYLEERIPCMDWGTAVDVGCGTGQATNLMADFFAEVYGFDVSPSQIREAIQCKQFNNISFHVSPAESLKIIPSNSVQLVTAVEAVHWFDLVKFFTETDRIVVANGVVAFIGYMMPEPFDPDHPEDTRLADLVRDAYFDRRLAPHKNPKIEPIESHYRNLVFPDNYEYVHQDNIRTNYRANAKSLIGFVESLSLYQGLVKSDPKKALKFIKEFEDNLKMILKTDKLSEKEIILSYDFFIAMGRKSCKNMSTTQSLVIVPNNRVQKDLSFNPSY